MNYGIWPPPNLREEFERLREHIRELTKRRKNEWGVLVCPICRAAGECYPGCSVPAARRDAGLEE